MRLNAAPLSNVGGRLAVWNGIDYGVRQETNSSPATVLAYPENCRTDGGECAPLWTLPVSARVFAPPVVAHGRLFVNVNEQLQVFRENGGARPRAARCCGAHAAPSRFDF